MLHVVPASIDTTPPVNSKMGNRRIIGIGTGTHTVTLQTFNEILVCY